MSVDLQRSVHEADDVYTPYRALSTSAVASLVVGLLSSLSILAAFWVIVPVCGVLLGVFAWRQLRSRPDELTGLPLAKAGLSLSAAFLLIGPGWLSYEYTHEVPPGCRRITYEDLQPNPQIPGEQVPQSALELDGQRIFIKGYVYPGQESRGIKTFVLVRDQGDCCFGGNPKITDRIQVTLVDPLRLTFRTRLHKVAGVFHVQPSLAPGKMGAVYYQLEADHLQ